MHLGIVNLKLMKRTKIEIRFCRISFLVFFNLYLSYFSKSQPKKYYVNDGSTTGDVYCSAIGNIGANGTSPSSPARTIQQIINTYTLGPGDTVFIDTGNYNSTSMFGTTYEYTIYISNSDNGNSSSYLVFKGAGKDKTILQSPTSTSAHVLSNTGADYVVYEDMKFENRYGGNCIIFNGNVVGNIVKNCDIIYNGVASNSDAIYLVGDVQNCIFVQNNISHIGHGSKGAICFYGASTTPPKNNQFIFNTIYSPGLCIKIYASNSSPNTYFPSGNKFINNRIENNYSTSVAIIELGRCINTEIVKNVLIQGNSGDMIKTNDNISGLKINNNFFVNNNNIPSVVPSAVHISSASPQIDMIFNSISMRKGYAFYGSVNNAYSSINLKNNILSVYDEFCNSGDCFCIYKQVGNFSSCDYNMYYVNSANDIVYSGGTKSYYTTLSQWRAYSHTNDNSNDNNSVEGNPGFLDITNNDLRVGLNSPATGSGTYISGINEDIYNNSRVNPPTIGAFEANSILPVVLIDFSGICNTSSVPKPLIKWTSAAEINNDHFILEKSKDLKVFNNLVNVKGAGNSNHILNYSFIDTNYDGSLTYYRLSQIDYDNQTRVLGIIALNCENTESSINFDLYPNPATDCISLISDNLLTEPIKIDIFDLTGRKIKSEVFNNSKTNSIMVQVNELSAGPYILFIGYNNQISKIKFIKK